MADTISTTRRSYVMSRIRGKNTKPEMLVRKFLHAHGFRYGLHNKKLPGTPDLVLPKYRTVILVHGCFWHGHDNCKHYVVPKTRTEFWQNKFNRNKANDAKAVAALKKTGWKVVVIWECDLKKENFGRTVMGLMEKLQTL